MTSYTNSQSDGQADRQNLRFIISFPKEIKTRTISDMKNRRYMLKTPLHLLNLHALTEVFPGAQLIFTHRKLTEVIPSFLSLTSTMHEQYGGVADHQWRKRYGRSGEVFFVYSSLW